MAEERVHIDVRGMHCANCAQTVEAAVADVPGVTGVDVNFATEEGAVSYDPDVTSIEAVYDAVEGAGYDPVREDPHAAGGHDHGAEARAELRRVVLGAALSLPLVAIMAAELLGYPVPHAVAGVPLGWIQLALATPVQVVLGWPFYESSWQALARNRTTNMDVLIALGSTTAYVYSVVVLAGLVAGGLYLETAALILVFITLGNYIEARSKHRTGAALRALLEMEPDTATLVGDDGAEREVPLAEVEVGDRLRVYPGQRVPTDGVVRDGRSSVDESLLTGESVPVDKEPGDEVVGGTINQNGTLVVEATRVGEATAVQQIVRLVRDAQARQPPVQRLADRVSAVFVPLVIANALLWAGLWYLFPGALAGAVSALPLWGLVGGGPAAAGGAVSLLEFSVVVFASAVLIACPCALGLATPTATLVGTTLGARAGILFKGGDVLERVREVDVVVLDKTGTLTEADVRVTDVVPLAGLDEDELLALAAAPEVGSDHPLAEAIVEAAEERGIEFPAAGDFESVPGRGVRATVGRSDVLVGNRKLLEEAGVDTTPAEEALRDLEERGRTAVLVARDGEVAGVIGEADTVKASAARAVGALAARGLDVRMVTGDNRRAAEAVAREIGLPPEQVTAEVLPEDKVDVVRDLQARGRRVAMVGDGVNDAPALAEAHVGIAIGAGADVAVEAGDVTLVRDDPYDVVRAIRLSDGTLAKVKQNLFWALGYNTAMIPLASVGLLQPALAAAAMAASSVSVVGNSLLFTRYDADEDYRILGGLRRLGRRADPGGAEAVAGGP